MDFGFKEVYDFSSQALSFAKHVVSPGGLRGQQSPFAWFDCHATLCLSACHVAPFGVSYQGSCAMLSSISV